MKSVHSAFFVYYLESPTVYMTIFEGIEKKNWLALAFNNLSCWTQPLLMSFNTGEMEMPATEFSLLPQNLQIDLLYSDGVYVGKRKCNDQQYILFQYESFYVEIHYARYRNEIIALNYHNSTSCLDPYLSQINAAELML